MKQDAMDKLIELKKLYEAGILTKEELEKEKQKVLGNETVVQESISASSSPTEKDNKKGLWIGLGAVLLVLIIIICVVVSKNKNTTDDYNYYDDVATDSVSLDEHWESDTYVENIDAGNDGIAEIIDLDEETYEQDESSLFHYRVNREVSVYQGPGSNYDIALFEAQGGRDYPASYDSGNIVESSGKTANGYIYVSDCGCQGGHGFNQDGWIPANAVSRMPICSNCGGAGYLNVICPQCDGGAYYSCSCHGRGMMVCDICGGVGAI